MAALALDPANATLEAEYYIATDPEQFRRVKPLAVVLEGPRPHPAGPVGA